jgi:hypothetical protein
MITISKIQDYVNSGKDTHEIARWILNVHLNKHVPFSLNDLSDNSTVADEVEAIVECIEEGDYQDALNIAEDGAISILQDEGFDIV